MVSPTIITADLYIQTSAVHLGGIYRERKNIVPLEDLVTNLQCLMGFIFLVNSASVLILICEGANSFL